MYLEKIGYFSGADSSLFALMSAMVSQNPFAPRIRMFDITLESRASFWYPISHAASSTLFLVSSEMFFAPLSARLTHTFDIPSLSAISFMLTRFLFFCWARGFISLRILKRFCGKMQQRMPSGRRKMFRKAKNPAWKIFRDMAKVSEK